MTDLHQAEENILDWQLVEAVLFSSQHALSAPQIKKITGIQESGKVTEIIKELNHFYKEQQRTFSIQKVAGGYQMRTLTGFRRWIKRVGSSNRSNCHSL